MAFGASVFAGGDPSPDSAVGLSPTDSGAVSLSEPGIADVPDPVVIGDDPPPDSQAGAADDGAGNTWPGDSGQGQGAGPPGESSGQGAGPGDQPCDLAPAQCCEYPGQGLFDEGSILFEYEDHSFIEKVPQFTQPPLPRRPILDENGDQVALDVERTVRIPMFRPCQDTCAGHVVTGTCECKATRCCEDESAPGHFYKEGSELNRYEYDEDGVPRLVAVEACPAPSCEIENVGYCANMCPSGIVAPALPDDMKDPEKPKPPKPDTKVISCDECPEGPEGKDTLCDPCPPLLRIDGKSQDEVDKWCKEGGWDKDLEKVGGDAEKFFEEKRKAVEKQIRDAEAAYEDLTKQVNATKQAAEAVLDQAETLAMALGGMSDVPKCGFPVNILIGGTPDYFECLTAWANDLVAAGKATAASVSAFLSQVDQLQSQVEAIAQQGKAAIQSLRDARDTLKTDFDQEIDDALDTLGLPDWKSQCQDKAGEDLEDCLGFLLDKIAPIILRKAKLCAHLGKPAGPQCQIRLCQGAAEHALKEKMDKIEEALPEGGLGFDEYPADPCCTHFSADFLVNSDPKEWRAGQFFSRSTKLGTFGIGWSAKAGRNLWVTLGDTGAYAYLASGVQYRLAKPPLLNTLPVMVNPACKIDDSKWNQACTDHKAALVNNPASTLLKLKFGAREWLATAAGSAHARIRYTPGGPVKYDGHLKAELKLLGERVWALPSGPGSGFEISGASSFSIPVLRFDLFDSTLYSFSYTVFTPIPFFVEAGVRARGVAFAEVGLATNSFGLRAYAGVGVALGAYLQGGIGVSLLRGRLKIAAGLEAHLLIARLRVGAAVEGGARQLPPSPDPDRQVVLAGYCFGIPYELRMFDGEVSVFASITLRVWRFKLHKEWRKTLFRWDGIGLSGFLWKRCETKCYAYEGATPYDQEYDPFDAMTPPDALPGPDRPPCWPHFQSKYGIPPACSQALVAAGLSVQEACIAGSTVTLPPECVGTPCEKLRTATGTLLGGASAAVATLDELEEDWKKHNPLKAATWQSAIEDLEQIRDDLEAAGDSLLQFAWVPDNTCKLPSSTKGIQEYVECMSDWIAAVKEAAAQLPSTDPAVAALLADCDAAMALYEDAMSRYTPLLDEMEAALDLAGQILGGIDGSCTCDRDLSDLAIKESPLRFVCGGESCGGTVCNAPCGTPYPAGDYYPDDPSIPPFSEHWPACCDPNLPPDFGSDCVNP